MEKDDAVIQPEQPASWPGCPTRTAVMVSSPADLRDIVHRASLTGVRSHVFMNSRMYCDPGAPEKACIAGPFIGAAYAVMLLETLVAWGIERIILFGWCGSVCQDVCVGDVIVPDSAFPGDGTSPHYCNLSGKTDQTPAPGRLRKLIVEECRSMGIAFCEGAIWTTDGVFRETPDLIDHYREQGAVAVEMETAALFAAGAYRNVEVAAVLAVSDEVHLFSWKTGFGTNNFRNARKKAIDLILSVTRKLGGESAA